MGAGGNFFSPAEDVQEKYQAEAHDAAQQSANQYGQECAAWAQEGADHRHHFYVAHPHAIALAHEFIEGGRPPQKQTPDGSAKQRIEYAGYGSGPVTFVEPHIRETAGRDASGEGQSHAKAGPVDGVGKHTDPKIRDDEDHQHAVENQELERDQRDAEREICKDEEKPGEEFDDGIHRRNRQAATAAFAAQQEPAEDRNVVVGLDGLKAARATRAGRNDGQSLWNTRDADIEEAAYGYAEKKEEERNHSFDCAIGAEEAQRGRRRACRMVNGKGRNRAVSYQKDSLEVASPLHFGTYLWVR
jgi:hypothetical protein